MNKEILQQFKEGKFSPLEIEVAKAIAFPCYPRQNAEWYSDLFGMQNKNSVIVLNVSNAESIAWCDEANREVGAPVLDVIPPSVSCEADAKSLDIATINYANWLEQVTRPDDWIIIGNMARALMVRLVPLLQSKGRKCMELVQDGKVFVSFREL